MDPVQAAPPAPVVARSRLLQWAREQVGVSQHTPRSPLADHHDNRIAAWQREFGLSDVAWCGCFVGYGLRVVAGISDIDRRIVWVPFIPEDARLARHGFSCLVPTAEAAPGDVAVLSWSAMGEPEHTGFVLANDPARRMMRTVEGNTTSEVDGDQACGGGVFERRRPHERIVACARPRYPAAAVQAGS